MREEAARALGRIGNPQVVERLIPALKDSDREVRKRAVEALGDIGGSQAVEGLIPRKATATPNRRDLST